MLINLSPPKKSSSNVTPTNEKVTAGDKGLIEYVENYLFNTAYFCTVA